MKLELASQPCHFFRVLLYESVQHFDMLQSGCSTRFRNNSTRKSIALHLCDNWIQMDCKKIVCVKNACKQEITNLVSHKRPLVQLEELLAVISTCTKLYKCSYLAGSVSYFVCNLYMKQYVKIITAIKKRVCNL